MISIKKLIYLFFFILISSNILYAQSIECPDNQCNTDVLVNFELLTQGGLVCDNGTSGSGDSLTLIINPSTLPDFDYFLIDWGDEQIETVNSIDTFYHVYTIPDSTICDNYRTIYSVQVTVVKECAAGVSCHSSSTQIGVIHLPRAALSVSSIVCVNEAFSFTDESCNADSISIDWGDLSPPTNATSGTHIYTTIGSYTVMMYAYNDCGASDIYTRQIQVVPPPMLDFITGLPIINDIPTSCVGDLINITNLSQNTNHYTWSITGPGSWFIPDTLQSENSENIDVILTAPGLYDLILVAGNACGDSTKIKQIYILENATVDLDTTIAPACDSITLDMINHTTFGNDIDSSNILWTAPSGTISNPNALYPIISFNTTGVHPIMVEASNICNTDYDTIYIIVQNVEEIVFSPIDPICSSSDADTLEVTPIGGVWTGMSLTTEGVFDPSTFTNDTTITVVYTFGSGVCERIDSMDIEIIVSPPVIVDANIFVCDNGTIFTLSASPNGGIWSGSPAITDSLAGTFDPAIAGIGDHELTYTYMVNGCTIEKMTIVTVEMLPTLEVDSLIALCDTPDDIDLTTVLTITINPTGGILSFNGLGITDSTGIFNSNQAGATGVGQYTIALTYERNDCIVQDTVLLDVIAATDAYIGVDTTVCVGDSIYTIIATPTGGISSGPGVNPSTGEINLAAAGGGTHTYIYVFSEGTTCETRDTVIITVLDLPSTNAGSDIAVCETDAAFQLTGFSPNDGMWLEDHIVNPVDYTITPSDLVPDSTYILTYCKTDTQVESCMSCDEMRLTVNALPIPAFVVSDTICQGVDISIVNNTTGTCTYDWDFGNGEMSTDSVPMFSYSTVGTYTITLLATSCETCVDSFSYIVTIIEAATADFTIDTDEGCTPLIVDYTNLSSGTDITYFWDFGNGMTSTDVTPNPITYEANYQDTSYVVSLAVINLCDTIYHYDTINVLAAPIAIFGVSPSSGCSDLDVSFANPSLGNPHTYLWDYGNGNTSTDSVPVSQNYETIDTTRIYTVTLIVTNDCGIDTLQKEIIVYPPNLEAFIEVTETEGCEPFTTSFQSFVPFGSTVSWDFGDGNVSNEPNPAHTYESAGTYMVIQAAMNCGTARDTVFITVYPSPAVSFTLPSMACIGEDIQLTNTSDSLGQYEWTYDDGMTSNSTSPIVSFDSAGTYVITLTGASMFNECTTTYVDSIVIIDSPIASAIADTTSGCQPLTVNFTNTGSSGNLYFYNWNFGDGNTSTEENPSHTFTEDGLHEVIFTVTDVNSCNSESVMFTINVFDQPISLFMTNQTSYCLGETIIVQNNSTNNSLNNWLTSDGQSATTINPTFSANTIGLMDIMLFVDNEFGCKDTSIQSVMILETPNASIAADTTIGCLNEGFTVSFINTTTGATSWVWDFGDGNGGTEENPTHTYNTAGDFLVTMTASNANGCPNSIASITITVHPNPTSLFIPNDTSYCFGETIILDNNSTGAITYNWMTSDGQSSTDFAPTFLANTIGEIEILLIAENEFGCKDTSSQSVTVLETPNASIAADPISICLGESIQFTNNSTGFDTYIWNFDDGNTSSSNPNPVHVYTEAGNYTVTFQAMNSNGCPMSTASVEVIVHDVPVSQFELSTGLICEIPTTINPTNTSINATDYEWILSDGQTSTATNPSFEISTAGTYEITLISQTPNGCIDSSTQFITIYETIIADFEVSNSSACLGDSIYFEFTGEGVIDSVHWDFGDGETSDELNPHHSYTAGLGWFTVTLDVFTDGGCSDRIQQSNVLYVANEPVAEFETIGIKDNYGDYQGEIQFVNESVDATSYYWDFGDGNNSIEESPRHQYQTSTPKEVTLIAYLGSCSDTFRITITPEILHGFYASTGMSPDGAVNEDARLFKLVGQGIKSYSIQVTSKSGEQVWLAEESDLPNEQPTMAWNGIHLYKGNPVPQGAYSWVAVVFYVNGTKDLLTGNITVIR